jgi:DNA-binding MarR family transcriptional regulator
VEAVADKIHSAALHLLRRLRIDDEAVGVSPPRLSALAVVVRDGPVTVGDLAAIEGVRPPTMTRLVDGLERDGLVRRSPHPDDGRAVLVRATAHGTRALAAGRSRRVDALIGLLSDLPGDDLTTLGRAADLLETAVALEQRSVKPG